VWAAAEIQIAFDDEASAGSVLAARISTPAGELLVMAEVERYDRELVLANLHIQAESLGRNSLGNSLGWNRLRQIARVVAEKADVETIVIKGSTRTTGAGPGRTPSQLRFSRAIPAAC
jgi:hypothetical protein